MFRRPLWRRKYCRSFPRIRGDVPPSALASLNASSFSPHTRGCSAFPYRLVHGFDVFPAYAGMFRIFCWAPPAQLGFPRIRGDVPGGMDVSQAMDAFSPHTRGCSAAGGRLPTAGPVFPAYAGMFRRSTRTDWLLRSFPRIRGDVPLLSRSASKSTAFSPHTRGCS